MRASDEGRDVEAVVRRIEPGARVVRWWPLQGGVSARVMGIEYEGRDGRRAVVVRQHGKADRRRNPNVAWDEARLLERLAADGMRVARLVDVEVTGEVLGTPYLVVELVEGVDFAAVEDGETAAAQMAHELARLHAVATAGLEFLPRMEERVAERLGRRPQQMDESIGESGIRGTLEAVWPAAERQPTVLLHGDYWPGNVLWRDGRIAAVLDWEDAAVGTALADVGNARLEILWTWGVGAMERFTREYMAASRTSDNGLAIWDLYAALRPAGKIGEWAGDAGVEARMRQRHGWFVTRAAQRLGGEEGCR